jgi:hypothetical protein
MSALRKVEGGPVEKIEGRDASRWGGLRAMEEAAHED